MQTIGGIIVSSLVSLVLKVCGPFGPWMGDVCHLVYTWLLCSDSDECGISGEFVKYCEFGDSGDCGESGETDESVDNNKTRQDIFQVN